MAGNESMWTSDELSRIEAAEELEIAPRRPDGSLRRPVTIWVLRRGDGIYVRSVNGPGSSWYRGSRARREGRIEAGGVVKPVEFVDDREMNDEIDVAYRTKYRRYSANTLDRITSPEARSTTIRLVPRSTAN